MAVSSFEQFGSLISSFKKGSHAPYISKIIVKDLSSLINIPGCDGLLKEVYSRSSDAKLIIAVSNSAEEYAIHTYIFDPQLFELQLYQPALQNGLQYPGHTPNAVGMKGRRVGHTNMISDICEDPCQPHVVLTVGNDGKLFQWNVLSAEPGVEIVVRRQSPAVLNSVACSQHHIAIAGDAGVFIYNRETKQALANDQALHSREIVTKAVFHPLFPNFLLTTDTSGMINICNLLAFDDDLAAASRTVPGQLVLTPFELSDHMWDGLQTHYSIDDLIFWGDQYQYIAAVSRTDGRLTVFTYNPQNQDMEYSVLSLNIYTHINPMICSQYGFPQALFDYQLDDVPTHGHGQPGQIAAHTDGMGDDGNGFNPDIDDGGDMIDPSSLTTTPQLIVASGIHDAIAIENQQKLSLSGQTPWLYRVVDIISMQYLPDYALHPSLPHLRPQQGATGVSSHLYLALSSIGGGVFYASIDSKPDELGNPSLYVSSVIPILAPGTTYNDTTCSSTMYSVQNEGVIICGGKNGIISYHVSDYFGAILQSQNIFPNAALSPLLHQKTASGTSTDNKNNSLGFTDTSGNSDANTDTSISAVSNLKKKSRRKNRRPRKHGGRDDAGSDEDSDIEPNFAAFMPPSLD